MNAPQFFPTVPPRRLRGGTFLLLVFALLAAGCARRPRVSFPPRTPAPTPAPAPGPRTPPIPAPAGAIEEGLASWYGVPYHGRRAANGEVYDMYKMTAAHRTLPFQTRVRVVNKKNGKITEVRINDRGPFIEGRIIDLSLAAAREIDMVADGVVAVRLEILAGGPPIAAGAFTVQVGAFLERENAAQLRERLARKYPPVFIHEYDSPRGLFFRVRVGREPSVEAAERLAERLRREENFVPFVVRLDEESDGRK